LLEVLHGRAELTETELAVAAFEIEIGVRGGESKARGGGADGFAILAAGGLGVGELEDESDVVGIGGESLAGGEDGLVVRESVELAAEAGGELEGAVGSSGLSGE
jgi:hypothetical protein